MNRWCNVVMAIAAVAVVLSTLIVTLRSQSKCEKMYSEYA